MLGVSQIFGPTIQGEGSASGQHCLFLRVYGCNLECSFCDTPYTWADTPEKAAKTRLGFQFDKNDPILGQKLINEEEVLLELKTFWDWQERPTIIVVTGGEPLMQQRELIPVMDALRAYGNKIHVETAGTIKPLGIFNQHVTQYNVSPKLASSGNRLSKRRKLEALHELVATRNAWFKFVLTADTWREDLEEVDEIVDSIHIDPRRVMLMPEGETPEANIRAARLFAQAAVDRGYGISFRTHILIWPGDIAR